MFGKFIPLTIMTNFESQLNTSVKSTIYWLISELLETFEFLPSIDVSAISKMASLVSFYRMAWRLNNHRIISVADFLQQVLYTT